MIERGHIHHGALEQDRGGLAGHPRGCCCALVSRGMDCNWLLSRRLSITALTIRETFIGTDHAKKEKMRGNDEPRTTLVRRQGEEKKGSVTGQCGIAAQDQPRSRINLVFRRAHTFSFFSRERRGETSAACSLYRLTE